MCIRNANYILHEDLDVDIVELYSSTLDLNGHTLYVRSMTIIDTTDCTIKNGNIVGIEQICPLYDLHADKNSRISLLPQDIVIKIATTFWAGNKFPLVYFNRVKGFNITYVSLYYYPKPYMWTKYSHYCVLQEGGDAKKDFDILSPLITSINRVDIAKYNILIIDNCENFVLRNVSIDPQEKIL